MKAEKIEAPRPEHKIQGRALSERFAPIGGWDVHGAIHELDCLLDGLYQAWEDAEDEIVGNRIFAIYYSAKRLLNDIDDLHCHELEKARARNEDGAHLKAVQPE